MLICAVAGIPSAAFSEDYYTRTDEGHLPFEDVKDSHWFYGAVEFCYVNSVVNGMNEYTFGHGTALTRAQFVTMLANAESVDTSEFRVDYFDDVTPDKWFYSAVSWAYSVGIVSGRSETSFAPNDSITREELSRIMYLYMKDRYTVESDVSRLGQFKDSDSISEWALESMVYLISAGLISGMDVDGELCVAPRALTTRAQTAVVMKKYIESYFFGDCEHSYTEATCVDRPVCTKCGMCTGLANGHKVIKGRYNCTSYDFCQLCHANSGYSQYVHLFGKANCNMPRTCAYCGITRGTTVGEHQWWAATCTNPKMCKVCYKTEGTSLGGHIFTQVTCNKASFCTRCGAKGTDALGHSYRNGRCSRCGLVLPYDRVVYAVKNKGEYNAQTGIYTYRVSSSPDVTVTYDSITKELNGNIKTVYSNGTYSLTSLTFPVTDHTARYYYQYYYERNYETECDWLKQNIEAHTFNTDLELEDLGVGRYYGFYHEMHKTNIVSDIDKLLRALDPAFSNLCGSDVYEFGFLNY